MNTKVKPICMSYRFARPSCQTNEINERMNQVLINVGEGNQRRVAMETHMRVYARACISNRRHQLAHLPNLREYPRIHSGRLSLRALEYIFGKFTK
jgi:hypothetical protein